MDDTIVAISTAMGVGAISIVRLSGKEAIKIVNNCFLGKDLTKVDSHTINYGHIKDKNELIDEVLVSVMRAPKTFTTEDVVEINCHGGIFSTNRILETMLNNGARLATPGEFTKRAFLNGRIDLSQSEAVMDIIDSKSEEARNLALQQLNGSVSNMIKTFREKLKNLLSSIEVNIDYPEYYDIEIVTKAKIKKEITTMKEELNKIINESKNSNIIKEGIKTVIVGRPNVGKSSILNKLLEKEKAIVTNIAGTTRDIVEGEIYLDGILLNIIDTAGIRETEDVVERLGVEKSISMIDEADLVIVVLNNNEKLTKEDQELLDMIKDYEHIIFINKTDLEKKLDLLNKDNIVTGNTKDLNGLDSLKEKIVSIFNLDKIETKDMTYLSNVRQIDLTKKACSAIENCMKNLSREIPVDMLAIDIKQAWDLLGEIIGENYQDALLDELFTNFCLGK